MGGSWKPASLVGAVLVVAACGTAAPGATTFVTQTVTETVGRPTGSIPDNPSVEPTATRSAPNGRQSWGGVGEFTYAVGDAPYGGLEESIPPGRYRVVVDPDSRVEIGSWMQVLM